MAPAICPKLVAWRLSIAFLFANAPLIAQQTAAPASGKAMDGVDRARHATVSLEVSGAGGQSSGSGYLIHNSGIVATAAHVIHGASAVRVRLSSGETYDVIGVLDYDERLDAAIVMIGGFELPIADLGNADSLTVGQRIIAIGSPLGLDATVTDGIVSAVRLDDGVKRLQISTPVAPGSSGGPVLTEQGKVVGMVVSGIRGNGAENLNFALPINYIRGKLGLLIGKAPTPLNEIKFGSRFGTATTSAGNTGVATLAKVNEGLGIDLSSIDGVQLVHDEKVEGQVRVKATVWYALSRDPSGTPILERGETRAYRSQGLLTAQDLGTTTSRAIFHVGSPNRFTTESAEDIDGRQSSRSNLIASGSQYTYQTSGGLQRTGSAPPGVFPQEMIGAVIAGLPDTLPPKVSFWVLDPSGDRVQEVSIEVLGYGKEKIPVAVQSQRCHDRFITRQISADVVRARFRIGLRDETVTLGARRPHLRLGQSLKCLYVPSSAGSTNVSQSSKPVPTPAPIP